MDLDSFHVLMFYGRRSIACDDANSYFDWTDFFGTNHLSTDEKKSDVDFFLSPNLFDVKWKIVSITSFPV